MTTTSRPPARRPAPRPPLRPPLRPPGSRPTPDARRRAPGAGAPPPRRTATTPPRRPQARTRPAAPPRPPRQRRPVHVGSPARRCLGLLVVLAVAFAAVVIRLVDLQVVSPDHYAAAGLAQRTRTVALPAERGSIFDRNGNELAMSGRQKTVWADPRAVVDPKATASALAEVLDVRESDLRDRLDGAGAFVYVARQIDLELADEVAALELPGVHLLDESKRFAPAGTLARSVLGGVNLDNQGRSGLELQFEEALVGTPGQLEIERGPDGRTIAGGRQHVVPAQRGNDIVTTIDRSLQFEVERALRDQLVETNAEHATAIVMNPTNGEILAMANIGRGADGSPVSLGENRALTAIFEPGSVNKVITIAGALEEGLVEPDTVLNVPDRLRVSTHTYTDHDGHPPANWTITDILAQSSNVGTIMLAQRLGEERVRRYLDDFGLGKLTGLGFPQETEGIMQEGEWNGTDIGSIPIGSGVGVNALQMLQVFNTLANGGEWVEPSIVREIVGPDGEATKVEAPDRRRVVSELTAKQVTAMMASVVEQGTGKSAAIARYRVAGKTGTAKKPNVNGPGYEPGAYFSSFAGFVPAEAPELSAIVVLDEPRPTYYAGLVAAPVFARIQQYALGTFRIPPPAQGLGVQVPKAEAVDPNRRD